MTCTSLDLTIDTALADPMIAAALRADRVDPHQFERLLRSTARHLDDRRRATPLPPLAGRADGTVRGCAVAW